MTLREMAARFGHALRADQRDRDLHDELVAHRDLLAEQYERQGLTPADARRHATLRLGGLDQGKESVRDARGFPSFEGWLRDVAYAVRTLRKSPAFATVTILTLALGIAVNVAIFSIVDAVVLRPLPYPHSDRLVSIWETETLNGGRGAVAPGNLADYRSAHSFEAIAGFFAATRNLTSADQPENLLGEQVTANYFAVLGVSPVLGRPFAAADEHLESPKVVIISDGLWRRRFSSDPAVVGRTLTLDGDVYEVVGVMPPDFRGLFDFSAPERRTFWLPAAFPPELLANRGDHEIRLVARLAPDATVITARTELTTISEALAQVHPETNGTVRTAMQPLAADVVRNVRTSLLVLWLTVALILTIACVNVANLFLARSVARRHEIALRFALGASRGRVVSALVTESLVLAAIAGVAGGVLAAWMQRLLVAAAPQSIPRLDAIAVDLRVLAYAGGVALCTGLLFALIPAWQAGHARAVETLAAAGRVMAGRSVMRWRHGLMLAQVALSTILLVGAGLMVKSLARLNGVPLGFDPDRVVAVRVVLPERRYPTPDARFRFFDEVEHRLMQLPGVQVVGYANNLPLRGGWSSGFTIDGVPPPPTRYFQADFQAVSTGYFAALGITHADGRVLSATDTSRSAPVAVVSREFERRFLGGQRAIGRLIRRGPDAPGITIVGIVDDVRRDGRTSSLEPQVYLPAAQTAIYPVRLADLAVRAHGTPGDLVPAIRSAVWSIDPEQPISNVRTLEEILVAGSADRRFQALLFSIFALLALVLASVGTYGVVAYVVTQRTPEIGVRLALGASLGGIHRWLLTQTMSVVAIGAVAGLAAARYLSQFVTTLLFDVTAGDPSSYVLAAAVLTIVALAASLLAGRRAAAIDPTTALRYE